MTTNDNAAPSLDALLAMDAGRELDAHVARMLGYENVRYSGGFQEWMYDCAGAILVVPRYSTDADVALALPIPDRYWWYLLPHLGKWEAEVTIQEPDFDYSTALTPALALVRAWLVYRHDPWKRDA